MVCLLCHSIYTYPISHFSSFSHFFSFALPLLLRLVCLISCLLSSPDLFVSLTMSILCVYVNLCFSDLWLFYGSLTYLFSLRSLIHTYIHIYIYSPCVTTYVLAACFLFLFPSPSSVLVYSYLLFSLSIFLLNHHQKTPSKLPPLDFFSSSFVSLFQVCGLDLINNNAKRLRATT